jgi:hypothetical protein
MKHLAILLLLLSFSTFAAPPKVWLEPVPSSVSNGHDWTEIAANLFFEVPASKLGTAEAWLVDTSFLVQAQNDLAYFGRPDFTCPAATKPYLVRAAYINGGTGSFSLQWGGSVLIVSHTSLGTGGTPSRSALVACLSQAPSIVFSSLSGAL